MQKSKGITILACLLIILRISHRTVGINNLLIRVSALSSVTSYLNMLIVMKLTKVEKEYPKCQIPRQKWIFESYSSAVVKNRQIRLKWGNVRICEKYIFYQPIKICHFYMGWNYYYVQMNLFRKTNLIDHFSSVTNGFLYIRISQS